VIGGVSPGMRLEIVLYTHKLARHKATEKSSPPGPRLELRRAISLFSSLPEAEDGYIVFFDVFEVYPNIYDSKYRAHDDISYVDILVFHKPATLSLRCLSTWTMLVCRALLRSGLE